MNNFRMIIAKIALCGLALSGVIARAQTLTVLHDFTNGVDGASPVAGLSIDSEGRLYGTAPYGGAGSGDVYRLSRTASGWDFVILYTFAAGNDQNDGTTPTARAVFGPKGHLFGTTSNGGWGGGAGIVYSLGRTASGWNENVLYRFQGGSDASTPSPGDLIFDANRNIYGTTTYGGTYGNGAVYELSPPRTKGGSWTEKVLYSFGASGDGINPVAGVIFDSKGNLYGTTSAGGSYGYGSIYELKHSKGTWTEEVLYNFQNATDGATPYGALTFDADGNLYGTATEGGSGGGGTMFELTPSKSGWVFNTIYSVPGWGVSGTFRDLVMDKNGVIWGTTHCDGQYSQGTMFKMTQSNGTWTYTSLHDFTDGNDGGFVHTTPVFDRHGNIFGTAQTGGANSYGVVWEITP